MDIFPGLRGPTPDSLHASLLGASRLPRTHSTSFRERASAALLFATVPVVLSCGGDAVRLSPNRQGARADLRVPIDVEASKDDAVMMVRTPSADAGAREGTSLQLDATVFNPQGHELPNKQHVYWTSLDERVVTVDSAGLVTAQDTGRAMVIVDHKKGMDTVDIRVIPVPVASVVLGGVDSISLDDTTTFTATPLDSAGEALAGRIIAWSTSVPAVASLSATGEAVALTLGFTDISAEVEGESASLSLRVWPQPVAAVEVTPSTATVPQFRKVQYAAILRDRRGKVLSDRAVAWASSAPAVVAIPPAGVVATANDVGEAVVSATAEGISGSAGITVENPVEARALWVTRFEYTTFNAVDFAKIATIFAKAASANFNVVYFQARTSGDALYYSDLEPCSPRMCGALGGPRPAQDPLDVALAEAAKHGIQVHAWLNAYTGFIAGSATACNQFIASTPANWLKANPQWSVSTKNFGTGVITRQVDNCLTTSEYMWVSPGVPEVRTQLARVAADITRRYGPKGLKGIHLDRIRYPSNQVSYDAATQEAFRAATGNFPTSNAQGAWLSFRRGLVNQGVRDVFDSITAVNPAFVLSAAVFPGYMPRTGWSAQWSFTDLFQDPLAWAQGGYLDVEVPMNYPATATSTSWTVKAYCSNTDWTCVLDDHLQRIQGATGRHVYVGVGAIRGWAEMSTQLALAHDRQVTGISVYSFSLVDAIPNGWAMLAAGHFKNPATIPVMGWKPGAVALAP
jgi:uncharacterized lipoprotein YddW (UPF0748 family)